MHAKVLASYPSTKLVLFPAVHLRLTGRYLLVLTDHNPSFFFGLKWYRIHSKGEPKRRKKNSNTRQKLHKMAEPPKVRHDRMTTADISLCNHKLEQKADLY